jgi:hypothetical protein
MVKESPHVSIQPETAWEAARAYGMDMSLLEANLQLTPLQRIRAHARALNEALLLREAMKDYHARS